MAMVTARRGKQTVRVSRRSYETMFRKRGYVIIGEDSKEENISNEVEERTVEEMEIEETESEVETIPISEMNKEQLAEYAKEHNIDTSSARNVREARQIIQKAIREEKM